MAKQSVLDNIKKELEQRRSRVKREFEGRIGEAQEKAEQYRKRIEAEKKKRDAKIAKIEENLGKRADAALRKRLGEDKYKRLQEWLVKKKQEEMRKLQEKFSSTGNEDYKNQLKEMNDTDPKYLMLTKYVYDKQLYDEMKRDVGFN